MADLPQITLASRLPRGARWLAVGCFEGEPPPVSRFAEPLAVALKQAASRPDWKGRRKQMAPAAGPAGGRPAAVLYGLGPAKDFDVGRLAEWLRKVVEDAARGAGGRLAVQLPVHPLTGGAAAALTALRLLAMGGYRFSRHRSAEPEPRAERVHVLPPEGEDRAYRSGLRLAEPVIGGAALARDLANSPPNEADPEWMTAAARRLARSRGMKIRVLGPRELRRMRMGGLLAVGGGSAAAPRLVRLEWGEGRRSVSLVGKGVTFDTGGISIKPSRSMDEMKYDKSGACAVLGVAQAAADLDLPFRFRAYLPLAENMPDGAAYRPGDILRFRNGKTVEIGNTDAEGRLILADALSWAAEEKPDELLELSTLTGSSVVALGHHAAALFTPDDEFAEALLEAGGWSGERVWRMPLWREFRDEMEGTHADLRNSAGRWGGASTAAAFLSQFVGDLTRWAHLDIAGTAYVGSEQKGRPGATGFGVALTIAHLLRAAQRV